MGQPIDEAFVEVLPDTDRFESDLLRSIDTALRRVGQVVNRATDNIGRSFTRGADAAGGAMEGIASDADRSLRQVASDADRAMDQVASDADQAADEVGRDFQRSGERAEDALEEIGDRGEREFDRIEREARDAGDGMGRSFRRVAGVLVAAFAAVQVGQFLGDAISEAADLSESINAVNVVLGEGADSFLAFGQTAADQLGITQAALNEAVVPIGALLTQAGSGGEALSGQLQDLATRATDVASVFNKDVNEVLNAFGSALRGETEPIRAFGVQLNAAAIDAKALELGLADASGEVDQAARTQAAFALIMEQTSSAAGDFANTADSLPNLMRRFQATLTETAGALGSALLPALAEVLDSILPAVTALGPVFATIGTALADGLTALQPFIDVVIGALSEGLEALAPALAPVGEAIGQLAAAFAPLLPVIGQLLGTLLPPLATMLGLLASALAPVIELVADFLVEAFAMLEPFLPPIVDLFGQMAEVLRDNLLATLPILSEALLELLAALLPLIPDLVNIAESLLPLAEHSEVWVQILQVLTELILVAVIPAIEQFSALLKGDLAGAFPFVTAQVEIFASVATGVFRFVRDFITASVEQIRSSLNGLGIIVGRVGAFFDGMRRAIVGRVRATVNFIRGVPGRIAAALGNTGRLLFNAGRNIIRGLLNGIRSMIGQVRDTIGGVAQTVRNFLPFSPAKEGPLSGAGDPERAGARIADMVASGIASQLGNVERAASTLAGTVAAPAAGELDVFGGRQLDQVLTTPPAAPVPTEAAMGDIEVRVFIGDRELTDIVDVQISGRDRELKRRALAGSGVAR